MSEQRFELSEYSTVYRYSVIDNIQKGILKANEIIILLSKQAKKIDEQQATISQLTKENEQLKSLNSACEYGQKSLMEEMKNNDEALDKIWEIMKELYGVKDE